MNKRNISILKNRLAKNAHNKTKKVQQINCVNWGTPLKLNECEYCGTTHYTTKREKY